jgi:diaminohydroxyphosphoribosylaminopyrimidine deaminase/5-amino-6-(5-phosphoribosylamino)uracil reductase
MQNNYEFFMNRCIELAKLGEGNVSPNPMVGAVLVYNNKIIGEGFHKKCGEAHAEVNAINSVNETELISRSTLFVSLEPCSHYGKTPPCTNLILANNIRKVVIGSRDINSLVNGKGIEQLKKAGVEIIEGVLENECIDLNKTFFHFHHKKRPFVTLKWASSKDGFIGKIGISNFSISNQLSKILVHKLRSNNMAIIVGTNTVAIDNPRLDTRNWIGRSPLRIIFDLKGKLNPTLNVFCVDENFLIVTSKNSEINFSYKNILRISDENNSLTELMDFLYKKNITSVLVEGGSKMLNSFIESNLWDEAVQIINDENCAEGIKSPIINWVAYNTKKIENDTHYYYKNEKII